MLAYLAKGGSYEITPQDEAFVKEIFTVPAANASVATNEGEILSKITIVGF